MGVQLEAIKFNHDPTSATVDALNIRRNATAFVSVPEWQRGVSLQPGDSPVAYAQAETRDNTVTIQAMLSCSGRMPKSILVRAVDPTVDPQPPRGCPPGCLPFWRLLADIIRALVGNVLGNVKARSVSCQAGGQTGWLTFELENTRLPTVGVGVYTTTWRWEWRRRPWEPWTAFDTSEHLVYVLVDTPTAPWTQAPYDPSNMQLPWTDVLDRACRWAIGAKTQDDAAAGVTRGVNRLSPSIVQYDCPGGGSTHYAIGSFNCTAFLDRLAGGVGNGVYVNCTDCATITSTFANALGCDLSQSQMGYGFGLNPIVAIGTGAWYPGCPDWLFPGFEYHEVAWKGACTENDAVFDACLEVDGDADPTAPPHTALLPTNLRFGTPGSGEYRDRLATPATRAACAPQPSTRSRRGVA